MTNEALEQEPCDDLISRDEVIDILLNEMECVQRASDEECNRDCAKCDLLRDTNKILQAYRIAIRALEHPEENVVAIVPCDDAISRQMVIDFIYRILNQGMGKKKSFEFIQKYVEKLPPVNLQEKAEKVIKMRDATPEEQKLVDEYIKSISKPTGVDFWDLEQEPKWIPVSERLPEDGQSVLFCDIDDDIMIGYHVKGRPDTHFSQDGTYEDMKNVRAWMPLPKLYEPQERSEKE